jgi:hypothetical protein|tara:strand:- start:821 stop:1012 length:192 start_codon:yes stop_codon:yes gene_type:complete
MLAFIQPRKMDRLMTKKKSIYDSGTTKGSAPRVSDYKKYSDNYDKIFRKKKDTKDEKRKSSNS